VAQPVIPGPPPPLPSDLDITASAAADIIIPPRPPLPPVDIPPVTQAADETAAVEPVEAPSSAGTPVETLDHSTPELDRTVVGGPVVDGPVVDEPVVDEPVVDQAVVDDTVVDGPVVDEPVVDEPVVDEPVADDTVVDHPVVDDTVVDHPVMDAPPALDDLTVADRPVPVAETVEDVAPIAPVAPPATAGDVLVMRGVTKSFGGTPAVDAIDLTVPAGTFYGLVGPNGAGKTTTLSMIAGLLVPDRGTVHVGGVDALAKPLAAKKLMGVLPDRLRTFDRLSGRQLLYYYGVLRGLSPAVVESRTSDLARAFDLGDALGRRVSDYSAGMLKKVMLAGAMIHSPRLLVLDEPFEAVDPVSSAVILDILSAYVSHGGTVILSSHGMELVERMCSRVAVIVAGQVLAEGTVDEVRGELTLEQRFVELAGGLSDVEGLEWLHTFSG
jgi:ABC-2 type transport system ATP-binding protein